MQSSAKAVGSSSGDMAETPSDADQSTISANVQAVGTNIQSLVSQHYALTAATGVDVVDRDSLAQDDGSADVITWDGSHLVMNTTIDDSGFSFVYDVDLDIASTDTASTIDGHFNMDFDISLLQYSTHSTYTGVGIDDTGCAASGTLAVDWSVDVGAISIPGLGGTSGTSSSGSITVGFAGCDTVTITGTGG
jgi:hypothetical protein